VHGFTVLEGHDAEMAAKLWDIDSEPDPPVGLNLAPRRLAEGFRSILSSKIRVAFTRDAR
jgi:hypothetical protein